MSKADKILAFIVSYIKDRYDIHLLTIDFPEKSGLYLPDGYVRHNEDKYDALYRVIEAQTGCIQNQLQLIRELGTGYRYQLFGDQHITYHMYLLELEQSTITAWEHTTYQYNQQIPVQIQLITHDFISWINPQHANLITAERIPELFPTNKD